MKSVVSSISSIHCSPVSTMPLARENPNVGSPKISVAQCVTHRIHCTINITKIIAQVPNFFRNTVCARGERFQQDQNVVWGPGDDKGKENGR